MAKAGHSNMKTTQIYLHLAGTVFHDEAVALERRLLAESEPVEVDYQYFQPDHDQRSLG
jgi:hypothetical protein